MTLAKDFIFNTGLEYPQIAMQGVVTSTPTFSAVTLKTGVNTAYDYQVFGETVSSTYGTGLQRLVAWIDASGNLRCNTQSNTKVYWRVYGY